LKYSELRYLLNSVGRFHRREAHRFRKSSSRRDHCLGHLPDAYEAHI